MGLRTRRAETVGYEVLVRMRSPEGELLAPDKFVEAADRYGLMPAIDRWVVCSTIDVLRDAGRSLDELPCALHDQRVRAVARGGQYPAFALEQLAQAGFPAAALSASRSRKPPQ